MDLDWQSLDELRAAFLDGSAGAADYWHSDALLAAYDATFARRIAWKWQWVFTELDRLGWQPPEGPLVDFGCGTGAAAREFLTRFGTERHGSVQLHDRSPRALQWAAAKVRAEFPGLTVECSGEAEGGTLLASHVLPELDDRGRASLLQAAERARSVLIVEPGTHETSRKLIAVREALRAGFHPVAPCVHRTQCGLLAAGNERHWCHFFAKPPPEVFTDSKWVRFGRLMGIDLRSLPLSFLVLDRREPFHPDKSVRVLGSPRIYKGYALLQGCDVTGVRDRRLSRRSDPAFFKLMEKGRAPTLQQWTCVGDDITAISQTSQTGRTRPTPGNEPDTTTV